MIPYLLWNVVVYWELMGLMKDNDTVISFRR